MSFPQLGYPQYISASQAVYGSDRPGVLAAAAAAAAAAASGRPGGAELGSGSAAVTSVLGMYASPYSAPNYSAFLPYTADLSLFSQMGSQYELKDNPGVHPATFAAHTAPGYYPYGQFQYGDPGRPKNATRESTSTLKAWLNEHRKNPYPTKGEKIMLAIITKMTLTQVSTWFANARRRLKKENKMTWAPRNKSEDEDEDEGDGARSKEESSDKVQESNEASAEDEGISLQVDSLTDHSCSAESDGEKLPCRGGDTFCESGSDCKDKYEDIEDDEDEEEEAERNLPAKPVTSSPLTGVEAPLLNHPHESASRNSSKATLDNRISPTSETQANKPKLWSLAEIATSDLKNQNMGQSCQPPTLSSVTPSSASHTSAYSPSSLLGRHIYYTSPFYSNYTNYGNFNALQSQGILRYNTAAMASNEGLGQTVLNTNSVHKQSSDSLKTITNQLEQHYRPSSYESKKDPTDVCTVGVQPYL